MFGLTFLFSAGLWALPVAALPIVVHLLFRRKTTVIPFPTLRFLKSSVQHTAARKKVQRWLLLGCRALLLALLIWAIAQPALRPRASFASAAKSSAAVIVVDTTYSMQLTDGQATLLNRADAIVRDLLVGQLRGAKVAILRSAPAPADRPELRERRLQEQLRDVSEVRWSNLTPQPALQPLADRVNAGAALLARQPADEKWLIVISDFQRREFPRSLPDVSGARLVLLDLHPADEPRSAAVTRVSVQPEQPTPGIRSEAIVELTGRAGGARQVDFSITGLDDKSSTRLPPQPANLDGNGHARLRFPLEVPAKGWLQLEASLPTPEPLAWGQSRSLLLEVPPREIVTLLPSPQFAAAREHVGWALDPSAGQSSAWPLSVRSSAQVTPETNAAVLLASDWPDAAQAGRLLSFVRNGGTLIWFIRPGLQETWAQLPANQQAALTELLPALPVTGQPMADANSAAIAAPQDPALAGLTDERFQIGSIGVQRYVPFGPLAPQATALLNLFPTTPAPGLRPHGLLFRRPLGAGTVFTFATLPDRRYSSIYLHPIFPPLLVQMALRPPARGDAHNIEIGHPLVLEGQKFNSFTELRVQGPQNDTTVVKPTTENGARRFVYDRADAPGLYTWRRTTDDAVVAMSNVQLPAAEAELKYTPADALVPPGASAVVARSAEELAGKLDAMSQPEPRWTAPIALVMLLLCLEALMGSAAGLWKPIRLRAFLPRLAGRAPV